MAKQDNLLAVEDARDRVLQNFRRLGAEAVAIEDAHERVLAGSLHAPMSVPPFANSSMDGFAVWTPDTVAATSAHPVVLDVAHTIPAGYSPAVQVQSGTCARIMTGAPIPPGSDGVVPFEDVDDRTDSIRISVPIAVGACVRFAGQDVAIGEPVLEDAVALRAPHLGLLASLGCASVSVTRSPKVAILSTGDELIAPGHALLPGQIYNSNSPMLVAAVLEAGGIPVLLPSTGDDEAAIFAALAQGSQSDLILTSGGASVGDFDHVKSVIEASGEIAFWRVRMRPGKPLIFGHIGGTPIIGLPGNPTSAMVTFEQFARPAIRAMLGLPPLRPRIHAVLDADMDNRGGRRTYARVILRHQDDGYHASPAGPQDSAMLVPLAHADGLMEMPEERESLRVGETVSVQVWHLPA